MNLLNFIGVGTVCENKLDDTHFIKMTLKREFPQMDGELKATLDKFNASFPTEDPGAYQTSKGIRTNWYTAKWLGLGTNRITSPNVIVGSPVAIYQFAGDDLYYWTTWGIGTESMRLEHIIYAWNADPKHNKDALFSFDNYYTLIISTRDRKIQLRTTQANKEKVAYDMTLDTGNSKWHFKDTERNSFALDSLAHTWVMRNWEESIFTISREDISLINKGTTLIKADKAINVKTKDLTIETENFKIESGDFDLKTKKIMIEADTGDILVQKISHVLHKHIGNLNVPTKPPIPEGPGL